MFQIRAPPRNQSNSEKVLGFYKNVHEFACLCGCVNSVFRGLSPAYPILPHRQLRHHYINIKDGHYMAALQTSLVAYAPKGREYLSPCLLAVCVLSVLGRKTHATCLLLWGRRGQEITICNSCSCESPTLAPLLLVTPQVCLWLRGLQTLTLLTAFFSQLVN
eukprot:5189921-Amphidinium_carterae.2